jgi:hydroxymethylpyrimidine pyrophosphatase-like HAD family hydrolase
VSLIVREVYSEKVRFDLMGFPSIRFVNILPSSPRFIEMVSSTCTKEEGIRRVLQYQKTEGKTIIAIGDYLNDIEMLKMADIAACPENSIDDVKKTARIITCVNNDGAVGDLIERLLVM